MPASRSAPWPSLPVFVLAALLLVFYTAGSPASHESGDLLLLLNFSLTTLVSAFIAALAGRSFLLSGRPALLAICSGMIVWGASALVAAIGEHVGNYNLTIHNLGLAAAGLCHLAGAMWARKDADSARPAAAWLALAVGVSLCSVGAIWMATQENWLPPFFIDGVGSTTLRRAVLLGATATYALAAALTWLRYSRSGWRFLLWYSLGLALVALGAIGLIVQPTHGSWLGWVARLTQYLGGIYMLIGTLVTVRESGRWELSTRERLAQSEQALREQAELLELAHDAIIVRLMNGRITYWNTGAREMYGFSAEEAQGQVSHDLLKTEFPRPLAAIEAELQRTGRWEGILRHTHRSGRTMAIASRWALRSRARTGAMVVLEINRDISEQQEAEASLRAADRRKDEFLATLAHELRNPLAPIRNAALILDAPAADENRRRWAREVISRQVRHMSLLLDDLLDVSRITRGKLELKPAPVELRAVVDSAVEMAQPLIEAKRHRLVCEVRSGSTVIEVDRLRIAQVLANLLTNAAKFTGPDGTIELTAEARGEEVHLTVRDSGIGFSAESLPRLFTLFSQLTQEKDRGEEGLGIGLALAKGLTELHGGRIEARSEGPGLGSEFIVRLPARAAQRVATAAVHAGASTAAAEGLQRAQANTDPGTATEPGQ